MTAVWFASCDVPGVWAIVIALACGAVFGGAIMAGWKMR